MDSPPDSTTPPPISQAILRLYKPQKKIFDVSMRISKLSPYLSCDTRGSGTLYNTKKGRYYLLRLSEKADLPLTEINKYLIYTNDIELSKNHRHTFRSTSNKPNLNYILGIYLTFVFSLNRQFHKDAVNKYFSRLRHLLKEKLLALRNRLESTDNNERKTKTFIRFSCGHHVIYLGFYFPCGTLHFEPGEYTGSLCFHPPAFVQSNNRWRCGTHLKHIRQVSHTTTRHPVEPRFYAEQFGLTVNRHNKNKRHHKAIHSNRLGISYIVQFKRYRSDELTLPSVHNKMVRPYYKQYRTLRFDAVRSPQQQARWNRLTMSTLKQNRSNRTITPHLLPNSPGQMVFKTIHHLPHRYKGPSPIQRSDIFKNSPNGHMHYALLRTRQRIKNWIRRTKKRNRLKKQLPPLPAGFIGDQRTYYYDTYNINLFDYNIRRRYNVSSIPQYDYGYSKAVELYRQHHDKYVTMNSIQPPPNVSYHIKKTDQHIFNDPNLFFRRTPPPDNDSHTTMSDITYFSASEGPSVVEFPPTPSYD
ncbi:hypothetical protein GLOIN_2v1779171 [Rhizophagus irregularis DAOM 181602=DAOM 197198]|uniref:Uncharacterized protein n=2 Tax=Rhizophagus irregularis TaxID=588596 RepID=A0A015LB74_RHIIW|nr:hypothetical protein GLOIN_2v1779171 [Rhizophagus irregularis DAOM 181602=DAOM 197198]EXX52058.1 hypothetical protein RirG_256370 [Rhizophagus irregularis DAOM 197198w]POG67683.1 hypothetical protein GLOIN_2v1779171 [Rhizophagus irregularis DAOM 181602=DAOM 197198]GBC17987.1 hypothetical protein GLOIN_2v1779171 [Rhizophagus irregularis DAOM 181602=DAOM 197198]|eukprot:XP_025174549.1 hypothetical protein GLOIN_2v1779171 [Rhizophagus irregularis DAOM 181602=DAOM 197198]